MRGIEGAGSGCRGIGIFGGRRQGGRGRTGTRRLRGCSGRILGTLRGMGLRTRGVGVRIRLVGRSRTPISTLEATATTGS